MKEKLILIGNGMAAVRTLEELLKLAPDQYDITVFGGEPYGNYNRILLSPVLAGEKTIDEIMLNDEQWYADNGITLHKGKNVVDIDRAKRVVKAEDGTEGLRAARLQAFDLVITDVDMPGMSGLEAARAGLPIVAAERDYVRDIVTPAETFDPGSPVSIARAVLYGRPTGAPLPVPVAVTGSAVALVRV